MKRHNETRTFCGKLSRVLSGKGIICVGAAALLGLAGVETLQAQQLVKRGNELVAVDPNANFFSTMKEMRERAAERYSNLMNPKGAQSAGEQGGANLIMQERLKSGFPLQRFMLKEDKEEGLQGYSSVLQPRPVNPQYAQSKQQNLLMRYFSGLNNPQGKPGQMPSPQTVNPQMVNSQMVRNQQMGQPKPPAPQLVNTQVPPRTDVPQQVRLVTASKQGMKPQTAAVPMPARSTDQLSKASATRESAAEVIAQIPWKSLSAPAQRTARSLVSNYSFYRRLPMTGGYCNPEVYDYILCHPEVIVGLWEAGGFDQISLTNNGNGHWTMQEQSGTRADVDLLYHDNSMMVFHAAGRYEGQLATRPIQGDVLCVIQYRFTEDAKNENKPITVTRFDAFVRMADPSADFVSKAFAPMIGKVVDSNFVKMADSVNQVSEVMEKNPAELANVIQKSSSISDETKAEFLGYIERVTGQASMRSQGVPVDYYLAPKMNVAESMPAPLLSRKDGGNPNGTAVAANNIGRGAEMSVSAMPLPTAGNTVIPLVSKASKSRLGAEPVLGDEVSMEEFSLGNDGNDDLVFSNENSDTADQNSDSAGSEELSFDLEYEGENSDESAAAAPAVQSISVAKPVKEEEVKEEEKLETAPVPLTMADDAEQETELEKEESEPNSEGDGWNAVKSGKKAAAEVKPVIQPKNEPSSGGQKFSWKKPELK